MKYIYEATKYFEYLKEHHFKDHEARWQNLGELLNIANRTREAASKPSDGFYDENGFVDSEVEDDIDMEEGSDFSDIDIDRYRHTNSPKEIKKEEQANIPREFESENSRNNAPGRAPKDIKKEEQTSIRGKFKSESSSNDASGKAPKHEPSVKPEDEGYILEDA